jgi:hypothetical protein
MRVVVEIKKLRNRFYRQKTRDKTQTNPHKNAGLQSQKGGVIF